MPSVALEIHPLSPAREADFMAFFDGEAFSDNPKWSSCYCQCFYEDHTKIRWAGRSAADNRACAGQRIARGQMQGRGVATALLDAACEHLRAQGMLSVEANPRPAATSTAENHFGPLAMYLAAGFTIRRTDESDGSVWVGKELQKAHAAPVWPAAQPHASSVDQPTEE